MTPLLPHIIGLFLLNLLNTNRISILFIVAASYHWPVPLKLAHRRMWIDSGRVAASYHWPVPLKFAQNRACYSEIHELLPHIIGLFLLNSTNFMLFSANYAIGVVPIIVSGMQLCKSY
jgi:hypothetical protein